MFDFLKMNYTRNVPTHPEMLCFKLNIARTYTTNSVIVKNSNRLIEIKYIILLLAG